MSRADVGPNRSVSGPAQAVAVVCHPDPKVELVAVRRVVLYGGSGVVGREEGGEAGSVVAAAGGRGGPAGVASERSEVCWVSMRKQERTRVAWKQARKAALRAATAW